MSVRITSFAVMTAPAPMISFLHGGGWHSWFIILQYFSCTSFIHSEGQETGAIAPVPENARKKFEGRDCPRKKKICFGKITS
jgi:hypothetical protein